MNLLLLEPEDFNNPDSGVTLSQAGNQVRITGPRFMHIKKVIKPEIGSSLVCGELNGKMGVARVDAMDRQSVDLTITLDQDPPSPLPLTLVLALPRPKMLKRILQAVASMGVKEIYLINSWRVEKSFWLSDLLDSEKLDRHLKLGLAQAKDTLMPKVYLKRYFTSFVKEELSILGQGKKRILAHPKTSQPSPFGVNKDTVLVIGPEGGFIDLEVNTLADSGFEPYHMGPRILRVETAVTALISRLFTL